MSQSSTLDELYASAHLDMEFVTGATATMREAANIYAASVAEHPFIDTTTEGIESIFHQALSHLERTQGYGHGLGDYTTGTQVLHDLHLNHKDTFPLGEAVARYMTRSRSGERAVTLEDIEHVHQRTMNRALIGVWEGWAKIVNA